MAFKAVLLVCASALLVQSISGQRCGCCGSGKSGSYGRSGVSSSSCVGITNSGGDLQVTSIGPISPSGISVQTDLDLNGQLDVNGELPFLSAVAFQGQYDTQGSACVDYSCGTCGNVAINSVIGSSGSGCGCGSSSGCGCGSRSGCGCGCGN